MFPEDSLRQETERKQFLTNERGSRQIPADEPADGALTSILDEDEEFPEEDLYLDLGVGD